MSTEGFHFERVVSEAKKSTVELLLPKSFESKVLGAPLEAMVECFTAAGVPEQVVSKYRAAVQAFTKRPTNLDVGRGFEMNFSPQDKYFAPRIYVPNRHEVNPDALQHTYFKPHLSKGLSAVHPEPADAEYVLSQLRATSEKKTKPSPSDTFTASLNRLLYSLHEPIHIMQALMPGDRINFLKEAYDLDGVIEDDKAKEFIRRAGIFDAIDQSALTSAPKKDTVWGGASEIYGKKEDFAEYILGTNEATMDILSEEALRPILKENPTLLLWAHNTISGLVAALRKFHETIVTKGGGDDQVARQENWNLVRRLNDAIGSVDQVYFAAFDSSEDALRYFEQRDEVPTLLGKHMHGAVMHVDSFDRFDIYNMIDDISVRGNFLRQENEAPQPVREYTFPLSDKKFAMSDKNPRERRMPLTRKGAELIADIYAHAAQKGIEGAHIGKSLQGIKTAIDSNSEETLVVCKEEIANTFGIEFSDEEIRELYGAESYLNPDLVDYKKGRALRKVIWGKMNQASPATVHELVRSLFFEMDYWEGSDYGFFYGFREKNRDNGFWRSWEDIESETSLGVLGVDVTQLSSQEKMILKAYWEQKDTPPSRQEQKTFMDWMARTRKQQKHVSSDTSL